MAENMSGHTILVGFGNVGARILQELIDQDIPTVVIANEREKRFGILDKMAEKANIVIIFGEAAQIAKLKAANVSTARALIAAIDDDLLNFRIAVNAKELNPNIRTVIRIFDQIFARKATEIFDIDAAISTSAITASAFVARSWEDGIIQSFKSRKTGTDFHLFELSLDSEFDIVTVEFLEEEYDVTIFAVNKEAHPEYDDCIGPGAKVLLLGSLDSIRKLKERYC
ncbi:MAG: potassium channel family protein [Candidatus Hodarchaeota archaeon]